jgi:capsular polysaccharide export protein
MANFVVGSGGKTILLLQGPVGGFFGYLGTGLAKNGYKVVKVHFNAADRLLDAVPGSLDFTDSLAEWPAFFERLCRRHFPALVLMFGDCRPVHAVASDVCARLEVPVYSFEEGYIRPNYVTFEPQGNNARSLLASTFSAFAAAGPRDVTTPPIVTLGSGFWPMSRAAAVYFCLVAAGRQALGSGLHHRERSLRSESASWARCAMRHLDARLRDAAAQERLTGEFAKKYFMLGLQVFDDLQIKHHANGWTAETLLRAAITSFARSAPADARLVVKQHPLDLGHRSYEKLAGNLAAAAGCLDRVHYLRAGHAPTLLRHAAGLITINSTLGLSALHHHCPVLVVGDAFYAQDGLAARLADFGSFDRFWTAAPQVDPELAARFRQHVINHSQLSGSFYLRTSWPMLLAQVEDRLLLGDIDKAAIGRKVGARKPREFSPAYAHPLLERPSL